jgi:hypothetical protein
MGVSGTVSLNPEIETEAGSKADSRRLDMKYKNGDVIGQETWLLSGSRCG